MNDTNPTAKRIFNALAFANVNNLGEFRALLRQVDEQDTSVRETAQPDAIAQASAIGQIQGAL